MEEVIVWQCGQLLGWLLGSLRDENVFYSPEINPHHFFPRWCCHYPPLGGNVCDPQLPFGWRRWKNWVSTSLLQVSQGGFIRVLLFLSHFRF